MKPPDEPAGATYLFGVYRVDSRAHELSRGGTPVPLPTRKAFDTLVALLRHRERVLRKEELIAMVWPEAFVSDDSLAQCISMLRRALEDDAAHPKYIGTIQRQGYRFIADVQVLDANVEPAAATSNAVSVASAAAVNGTGPVIEGSRASFAVPPPVAQPSRRWMRQAAAAAALLAVCAGVALISRTSGSGQQGPLRVFHPAVAESTLTSGGVLSPDGHQIAFVARSHRTGAEQIWVRRLDTGDASVVDGTSGATRPFWSPDGGSLAFFADGKLRRVDIGGERGGGPPRSLAPVGYAPAAGSWGANGTIVFATRNSVVYAIPEEGGAVRAVTTIDDASAETWHGWPQFLPDGRHFLYVATLKGPNRSVAYIGSLDAPATRVRLIEGAGSPVFFAAPDALLYVRDGALLAQRFDVTSYRLQAKPIVVARRVSTPTLANGGVFSAAGSLLAFWGGPSTARLAWYARSGQRTGVVNAPMGLHNPMFSPDESQVLAQGDPDRPGIWLVDLDRDAPMNVINEGIAPAWSPAGDEIVFGVFGDEGRLMRIRPVNALGRRDRVVRVAKGGAVVLDWSADGRYLLYSAAGTSGSRDTWVVPVDGTAEPRQYLQTPANEVQSRLSPDGRWVAYTSDESGTWQVYLESFPTTGVKRAVSIDGGTDPQWRRDGRELFFVAPDGTMTAVDVDLRGDVHVGAPRPLFRAPLSGDISAWRNRYAVTGDGQRFLIDTSEELEAPPIELIVNWSTLLRR